MNRICKCEVQKLFPILEAIKEGKTIQFKDSDGWRDINGDDEGFYLNTLVEETDKYRIKPEPKYRPFKDAEECWNEMQKHRPFGWVKDKKDVHHRVLITAVDDDTCGMSLNGNVAWSLSGIMDLFTFADGTPFGVKVEE